MRSIRFAFFLALLPTVFFSGCEKDSVGPEGVTSSYYFVGDLEGATYIVQNGQEKYGMAYGVEDHFAGDEGFYDFNFTLFRGGDQPFVSPQIWFRKYYFGPEKIEKETFENIFAVGERDFWAGDSVPGVEIKWYDANGKEWSSAGGIQTASQFNLIESEPTGGVLFRDMKARAEFSCRLYDGEGNTLLLQNGEISARFGRP